MAVKRGFFRTQNGIVFTIITPALTAFNVCLKPTDIEYGFDTDLTWKKIRDTFSAIGEPALSNHPYTELIVPFHTLFSPEGEETFKLLTHLQELS